MKFWEAMKALQGGEIVRIKTWPQRASLFLDKDLEACFLGIDNPDLFECMRGEWEIYFGPQLSFMEMVKELRNSPIENNPIGYEKSRRFTRRAWADGRFVFREGLNWFRCNNYGGEPWILYMEDYEANDWVEIK